MKYVFYLDLCSNSPERDKKYMNTFVYHKSMKRISEKGLEFVNAVQEVAQPIMV